jgi:eukaryotic-like serine/threonine-protein kinase
MGVAKKLSDSPSPTAAGGADEETARKFFQDRIAFFVKTMAGLFAIVLVLSLALVHAFPYALPPHVDRGAIIAGEGVASLCFVWGFTRWRAQSLFVLRILDAVIMITSGIEIGLAAYLVMETPAQVFVPFTLAVLLMFARVFTLPSSAMRTLWLSLACMVPVSTGNIMAVTKRLDLLGMPFPMYVAGGVLLAGSAIGLATIGSSIIYGLRREVREAKKYGQYTIDRKLGEGGMGVVYLARHAMLTSDGVEAFAGGESGRGGHRALRT